MLGCGKTNRAALAAAAKRNPGTAERPSLGLNNFWFIGYLRLITVSLIDYYYTSSHIYSC